KAVLLYFRVRHNRVIEGSASRFFDKVPLRWAPDTGDDISRCGARIVPPATVRRGAFVGHDAVLMPSYVNIGAYVGAGSMVDTWATVGSCAQIGERVHLSGGVGIGGVLEPLQATPTIIEDDCFIGARSEVVEGVIIGRGSVLSMGVYIGNSTRIFDRESGEIMYGRVPAGSVVVPGSLPAKDGNYALYAAVIVKRVDEKTRSKTSVNELLRAGVES
ncbi:MAG: 2,3,4,5-tetrahydropyridine-2,6-dicarboxylate N-succinyltransferase, partial [Lysobacterales bacterium]